MYTRQMVAGVGGGVLESSKTNNDNHTFFIVFRSLFLFTNAAPVVVIERSLTTY